VTKGHVQRVPFTPHSDQFAIGHTVAIVIVGGVVNVMATIQGMTVQFIYKMILII